MLSHTEGINPPTPVGLLTDTQASSSTAVNSTTLVGNRGFAERAHGEGSEAL